MADAAKTRKPPQPRGLTLELPLDHTQRALQLAQGAGLSTKAEVEAELSAFVVDRYLEPFLAHLGQMAIARVKALMGGGTGAGTGAGGTAPTTDPVLMQALRAGAGLTPDGGLPINPPKD